MSEIFDAVSKCYLVKEMPEDEVDALVAISEFRQFDGGMTMVRQFDKSKDLMLIVEGGARVNTFSGDKIIELGPGSIVGEMAILDNQPRSATVMSIRSTKVVFIAGEKLQALMNTYPSIELGLLRNISRVLCSYIRMSNMELDGQLNKQ